MKKILFKTGVYGSIFFAGLWCSILFNLLDLPIKILFEPSPLGVRIIRIVLGYLGIITAIFIAAFKEGYRKRKFDLKTSLFACFFVFAVQQILAPVISYAIYVVGSGSVYLADAIYFKNQYTSLINPPDYIIHLCMTISFLFIYIPLFLASEKLGVLKYIKDVQKMKNNTTKG